MKAVEELRRRVKAEKIKDMEGGAGVSAPGAHRHASGGGSRS